MTEKPKKLCDMCFQKGWQPDCAGALVEGSCTEYHRSLEELEERVKEAEKYKWMWETIKEHMLHYTTVYDCLVEKMERIEIEANK